MKRPQIIALGDLEIDPGARRVTRGGHQLELGRLSFDLLVVLIEAHPAALSNDQIVERVWAGDAVTDENVKQRVRLLRRALGQDSAREYVETLRGFGYRLVDEPRGLEPAGPTQPPPRPRPDRMARRLLLILAIISFLLLITVLAIGIRQVKRLKVGAWLSAGPVVTAQLKSPASRLPSPTRRAA